MVKRKEKEQENKATKVKNYEGKDKKMKENYIQEANEDKTKRQDKN